MLKKASKTLSILLLGLVVGFAGYAALNPLLLRDLRHTTELWWNGVRPIWSSGGLSGYQVGSCETSSHECKCYALIHGLGDQALGWRKFLIETRKSEWGKKQKWVALNMPLNPTNGSVRAIAKEVEGALRPLCPKWTIVGNSFGGWIGAWTALSYDGAERLILIGSAGLQSTRTANDRSYFRDPTVESLKEFLSKAYAHPRNDLDDKTLSIVVSKMKSSRVKSLMDSQTALDDLDTPIRTLTKPVTLIWGEKDRIIPTSTGHAFQKLLPHSRYVELKDCGHLPQKECPALLLKEMENEYTLLH